MKDSLKTYTKEFCNKYPEYFNICNPRKYQGVNGYGNPKTVGLWSTSFMAICDSQQYSLNKDYGEESVNDIVNGAKISARLAQLYMPYFWVYKDLAEAAIQTELPGHLSPSDILLPLEAFSLILPQDVLVDPNGLDFNCVRICKMALSRENFRPALFIQFLCDQFEGSFTYDAVIGYDETFIDSRKTRKIKADTDSLEISFLDKALELVATILVLMAEKPEIISGGSEVLKQKPEEKVNGKIPHAPNWIGLGYRIKSEYQGGTHSSPSLHWRRGHWRQQAHGSGRSLRKNIWIEPSVIGLKKAA
jgi:hypothetical protein